MLWVNWISQKTYLFTFLDLENTALLWDICAMKPIYFHAYLKSYPTSHFPVEMPQSSRKKQVQRDDLIFFLAWLWLQRDLAGFHMHQRAYFPKVSGHIHSGHTSHILSGKPQCWSMSRRKEKLSSRYKTSQLPQLIFALFDFHSLKRQIVNRIYILHVLSNLWISHLTPPFEDSADPCFFYNWCLICIKLVSFLKFIAFSVQ